MKKAVAFLLILWLGLMVVQFAGSYRACKIGRDNAHDAATAWFAAEAIRRGQRDYGTADTYRDVALSLDERSRGSCFP